MIAERRAGGEVRVAGRTLTGIAMPYGTVSPDFRERFEPGAFGEVRAVDVNLQHDPAIVLARAATLTDSPRALTVRAELDEGSGAAALVRRGALRGFSVEFHARAERSEAGVRVVERAELSGLALVDRPAYPAAGAEVRARSGTTLQQDIPLDREVRCECVGVQCRWAELGPPLQEAFDEAFRRADEILAVRGTYGTPLASKGRGSVRAGAHHTGDEAFVRVEVDLPEGPDGDQIVRDIDNTGATRVRPYLDRNLSIGEERPSGVEPGALTMRYSRIVLRSLVVGATDAIAGWPAPLLLPTADLPELLPFPAPEGREASRRRRVWL